MYLVVSIVKRNKLVHDLIGLAWFLCFNDISTFLGYLMPKPFS